jgi:hypothetical protein
MTSCTDPVTDPITLPGMLCSHELAEQVQREADEATELPWWFWEAAVVVVVVTLALSAVYPWGLAT